MLDLLARILGLAALVLALGGIALSILFIRREARVRERWDILRAGLSILTLALVGALVGVAVHPVVAIVAIGLGLGLGVAQGRSLRVRVAATAIYVRRDALGIVLWGLGLAITQGGALASSTGLVGAGQFVGFLGAGMQIGQIAARRRVVRRARARVVPTIAAALLVLVWPAAGVFVQAASPDVRCPPSVAGSGLGGGSDATPTRDGGGTWSLHCSWFGRTDVEPGRGISLTLTARWHEADDTSEQTACGRESAVQLTDQTINSSTRSSTREAVVQWGGGLWGRDDLEAAAATMLAEIEGLAGPCSYTASSASPAAPGSTPAPTVAPGAAGSPVIVGPVSCPGSLDGLPLNPRITRAGQDGPIGEAVCYFQAADFSVWASVSVRWVVAGTDEATAAGYAPTYCERTDEAFEDPGRPQELYGFVFPAAGRAMVVGAYEGDSGGASVASMQALARSLAASLEGASAPCPGAGGGGVPVPAPTSGASTPAPGGSEIEDDPIAQTFAELLGTDGPPPDLLDTLLGSIAVLGGSVAVVAVSMVEAGRSVGDARSAWAANGAKGVVGLTDLGRTTTIELSGDEARRVLAAQKGDVIEIPADERWGTIVSGGGRTERDDFLGTHGRIRAIGARVESADDIVISVDVDLVAPADASGGGTAAAAAGTVAAELDPGTEAAVADSEPSAPESEPAAESPAEPLPVAEAPGPPAPPSPEPQAAIPAEPAPPPEPESGAVAAAAGHPGPGEAAVSAAASSVATPPTPVERVRTAIAKQLGPDGTTVTGPIFDRVDALLAAGGGPFTLSADEFANLAGLDPEGRIEGVQLNDGHIVVRPTGAGIDVPIRPTVHRATGQVGFSLGATDIQELLLDAPVKAIATKLGVDIEGTTRGLNNLIDSTGLRVTGIRVAPDGIHIETVRGDPPDH